jgi:hypothetical protein
MRFRQTHRAAPTTTGLRAESDRFGSGMLTGRATDANPIVATRPASGIVHAMQTCTLLNRLAAPPQRAAGAASGQGQKRMAPHRRPSATFRAEGVGMVPERLIASPTSKDGFPAYIQSPRHDDAATGDGRQCNGDPENAL